MGVKASLPLEGGCDGELYLPKGKVATLKEVQYMKFQSLQKKCEIHSVNSPDSIVLAKAYNELGELFVAEGFLDASLEEFLKSLVILSQMDTDSLLLATVMFNISKVYVYQKLYPHALKQLTKALEIRQREIPESVEVAEAFTGLAYVCSKLNVPDKTADYSKLATELENLLHERALEADLENRVRQVQDLATYYQECGHNLLYEYHLQCEQSKTPATEAKNLFFDITLKYETALALIKEMDELKSLQASLYNDLGEVYALQHSHSEAVTNFRTSLTLYEAISNASSSSDGDASGFDHTVVMAKIAEVHKNIGDNILFLKDLELKSSAETVFKSVPSTVFNVETTVVNPIKLARASTAPQANKAKESSGSSNATVAIALHHYKQAEQIAIIFNPSSVATASLYSAIGSLHHRQKDLTLAAEYLKKTLTILEKEQPKSIALAQAHTALAQTLFDSGDSSGSLLHFQMASELYEVLVPDSHVVASTYVSIGLVYKDQGYPSTALVEFQKALAIEMALSHDSGASGRCGGHDGIDVRVVQDHIESLAKRPHVMVSY